MNMKVIVGIVVAAAAALVLYNWKANKPEMGEVKLRLVNVLDQEMFDDAHIKGTKNVESISVPFDRLESAVQNWDKTVPVVTYCANYFCTASGTAAKKLKELGFTQVWAYEGGTAEWYQLGKTDASYAVEGPAKLEYLQSVVKKPAHQDEQVQEISALELQKKIKEATI